MKKSICISLFVCVGLSLFGCNSQKKKVEKTKAEPVTETVTGTDGWIRLEEISLFCPEGVMTNLIPDRKKNDFGGLQIIGYDIHDYFMDPDEDDYIKHSFITEVCKGYSIEDFRNMICEGKFPQGWFRNMVFSGKPEKIVKDGVGIGTNELLVISECFNYSYPVGYIATLATNNYVYEISFNSKRSFADDNQFLEYEEEGAIGPGYYWKGNTTDDRRQCIEDFLTLLKNNDEQISKDYRSFKEIWEQMLSSVVFTGEIE